MIRRATLEDVPVIVEMAGHFITAENRPYHRILTVEPAALEQLAGNLVQHGLVLLGLDLLGRIVGMYVAIPFKDPVTTRMLLDEVVWWVEPAARSSSIGPKLLRSAEAWARQKGFVGVKMIAPCGSNVGRYYERAGYAPIETTYYKPL